MKINLVFAFLCSVLVLSAHAQEQFEVNSPDGNLEVEITQDKEGIFYTVNHSGTPILNSSEIALTHTDGTVWGKNARFKKAVENQENNTIKPAVYWKDEIEDKYNELTLKFRDGFDLKFRVYDEGVAYRFIATQRKSFKVEDEKVEYNLPGDPTVYFTPLIGREVDGEIDPFFGSFQNTYYPEKIDEFDKDEMTMLPILAEGEQGKKIFITEADQLHNPSLYLTVNDDNVLESVFPKYPKEVAVEEDGLTETVRSREDYIAEIPGKSNLPWRVIAVADNDTDLLTSDIVYKLAEPSKLDDTSWIKPGKIAWDWFNDWNLFDVDFESGVNNETYKYYIDFASDNDLDYVILDEGWAEAKASDLFKVVPEIDLEELIAYAEERGIDLILWAGYKAFEKDMEKVTKHYSEMGIKGFKIDFMNRDDQPMVNFYYETAEIAAKYNMLVDFHGSYKPSGLQRTYPNVINFEGVFGLEEMKWSDTDVDQVTYDVTFPYIRMVNGPVDYTQGAMRNAIKDNYRPIYTEPMSQGTRVHQLAMYAIFYSPLTMLADSPSNYIKEQESTDFISAVPTTWDETVTIEGEVGEYIAMARRHGDVWYVAALNNWDERDLELDLSFLDEKEYKAEIFQDGVNADKAARDYKRIEENITTDTPHEIHMAPGGGYIMRLTAN